MKFLDANCPYVHERDFRAIVFSSPAIASFNDVNKLLFESTLSAGEMHEMATDLCTIEHRFYYTTEDFTSTLEDRDKCRGKWHNKTYSFRYSIYFAKLSINRLSVFVVILPLMKMARKLYPQFEERGRGRNITYWRADLSGLIEKFRTGENCQGAMTLKTIVFAIYGDSKASIFQVMGADVATCITLAQIEQALRKKGIRYRPRAVRLLFIDRNTGERFNIALSRLGHLNFFINQGAANFPMLGITLRYLWKLNVFEETSFPTFRWPDEEGIENEG